LGETLRLDIRQTQNGTQSLCQTKIPLVVGSVAAQRHFSHIEEKQETFSTERMNQTISNRLRVCAISIIHESEKKNQSKLCNFFSVSPFSAGCVHGTIRHKQHILTVRQHQNISNNLLPNLDVKARKINKPKAESFVFAKYIE
jgi:hypothetical protein